jgi:hypothetical protein
MIVHVPCHVWVFDRFRLQTPSRVRVYVPTSWTKRPHRGNRRSELFNLFKKIFNSAAIRAGEWHATSPPVMALLFTRTNLDAANVELQACCPPCFSNQSPVSPKLLPFIREERDRIGGRAAIVTTSAWAQLGTVAMPSSGRSARLFCGKPASFIL